MRFRLMLALALALMALTGGRAAAQGGLPADALDKDWGLVSLQKAPGDTTDTSGKGITIQFAADGSVFGSDGCNRYRGTYTAGADGTLDITLGPSTLMACDQAVMDLAFAFTQALDGVESFTLAGGKLDLAGASGSALSFATAAAGGPAALPSTGGETDAAAALALLALALLGGGLALRRRTV